MADPRALPRHCDTCGALLADPGEFHPFVFCLMKNAGMDPWRETRWLVAALGKGELPESPPLIRETQVARV